MAGEKTEKATPKKRKESQEKGQVARSMDLSGAVVLMASLMALSAFAPKMLARMEQAAITLLALVSHPEIVERRGVGSLLTYVGVQIALAGGPVVMICLVTGVVINVAQVGFKPARKAIKPDFKKLNPINGAKSLLSPNSLVELIKNLVKIGLVGAIVVMAVKPQLETLGAMVGTPAVDLLPVLCHTVLSLAQRAALVYLFIGFADVFWQRYRHEKSLKMDKQSVKEEGKQAELPAEVKNAQRRKAFELSSARMMDAVPTADVVVVNPTHFSVALKYDSEHPAPIVVAKGIDGLALRIRELARENGIAVVPDPPLARTLYASVEIGKMIPEDLFHAVAQLLAYVYRVAGARKAAVA
jgi:flagellar biosynthetic protein FlhB